MTVFLNEYSKAINDYFLYVKNKIKPNNFIEIRSLVNSFYKEKRFEKKKNETINITYNGLKIRQYKSEDNKKRCIIYVHGGGFVFGDINQVDYFVSDLCFNTNTDVFSIDYKKAPEYIYPSAHNDVICLINYILETYNHEYESFYLMGCSAGSMIIVHTISDIKKLNLISGIILDSPALNLKSDTN